MPHEKDPRAGVRQGERDWPGRSGLGGGGELTAFDLLEAGILALEFDLTSDCGVHGVDNAGELGRLSGRQQKGAG